MAYPAVINKTLQKLRHVSAPSGSRRPVTSRYSLRYLQLTHYRDVNVNKMSSDDVMSYLIGVVRRLVD
jgi:hypothetical protein